MSYQIPYTYPRKVRTVGDEDNPRWNRSRIDLTRTAGRILSYLDLYEMIIYSDLYQEVQSLKHMICISDTEIRAY